MQYRLKPLVLSIGVVLLLLSPVYASAQSAQISAAPEEYLASLGSTFIRLLGGIHLLGISFGSIGAVSTGGGGSTTCPYSATASADGCAGANWNGSFHDTNLMTTTLPWNGQTYKSSSGITSVHPQQFNVTALDFPISYDKTLTPLSNPSGLSLPNGCTYSATGNAGNPRITCQTNATYNTFHFNGVNFSYGGICTQIYFTFVTHSPAYVADISITNSLIAGGTGCNGNIFQIISAAGLNVSSLVFSSNEVSDIPDLNDTSAGLVFVSLGVVGSVPGSCTITYAYNYIHDLPGDFAAGGSNNCNVTLLDNYYLRFGLALNGNHGAFFANTPTGTGDVISYKNINNICVYGNQLIFGEGGTTCFSVLASGNYPVVYDSVEIAYNTVASNKNAGANVTQSALAQPNGPVSITTMNVHDNWVDHTAAGVCATNVGSFLAMSGTVSGSVMTVSGVTGTIGQGQAVISQTGSIYKGVIAPYGTGSTNGIQCTGSACIGSTFYLCTDLSCSAGETPGNGSFSSWESGSVYIPTFAQSNNYSLTTGNHILLSTNPPYDWTTGGTCN